MDESMNKALAARFPYSSMLGQVVMKSVMVKADIAECFSFCTLFLLYNFSNTLHLPIISSIIAYNWLLRLIITLKYVGLIDTTSIICSMWVED